MYCYLPVFLSLFDPFQRDLTRSEGSLRSKCSHTKRFSTFCPCVNWTESFVNTLLSLQFMRGWNAEKLFVRERLLCRLEGVSGVNCLAYNDGFLLS